MESAFDNPTGALPSHVRGCDALTLCLSKFQTLVQQAERDDNVRALFQDIRDAFDLIQEADALRDMRPESKQAKIFMEMLQCVSDCATFITSYAEDESKGTGLSLFCWPLSN